MTKQTSMAGFFFKEAIGRYSGERVGNKVIERAVSGGLNPGDVLQLVIDRFYQGSFPQQDLVRHAHQGILHIFRYLISNTFFTYKDNALMAQSAIQAETITMLYIKARHVEDTFAMYRSNLY